MESLFGVPGHPLFVHLPMVVVPVAALAAAVLAFSPDVRRRLSGWLAAFVGVGLVGTFLAIESGEAFQEVLEDRIGDVAETHEQLGRQTMILVALFFVGSVITAAVDRLSGPTADGANGQLRLPASVLAVGTALLGLLAGVWMLRTGHEGIRVVWDAVLSTE